MAPFFGAGLAWRTIGSNLGFSNLSLVVFDARASVPDFPHKQAAALGAGIAWNTTGSTGRFLSRRGSICAQELLGAL